jgi:hypothetical protein
LSFEETDGLLKMLANKAGFEEATDTEVRESVYLTLQKIA